MVALFWATDVLGLNEGRQQGVLIGIQSYIDMSEGDQAKIRRALEAVSEADPPDGGGA